jgi:hypothetical protein
MKWIITYLLILASTVVSAQFKAPDEDLITSKECYWVMRFGNSTSGICNNVWIYFNDHYLIYHYETANKQHTLYYLIKKRVGGGDFCRDSCVTITCYDSAQSVFVENKTETDLSAPSVSFTIHYGGGGTYIEYANGRETRKNFIEVHISLDNVLGGFAGGTTKSNKALIPVLLKKYKKFEYENAPVDDVPFVHAYVKFHRRSIEANGFSFNGNASIQDSLMLVERKKHFDSLFNASKGKMQ